MVKNTYSTVFTCQFLYSPPYRNCLLDVYTQVVAAHSLMSEDLTTWRCQPAPGPEEIVWSNLGLRSWERTARGWANWICFILLMMFYTIPVALVQGLLSLDSLGVSWVQDIPIVNSIITGILPSLVLNIFLAFVPKILAFMNKKAGMVSG
jgi:hypothetical protein